MSAFISELHRKGTAKGPAFSFDQERGGITVTDDASSAAQVTRNVARPAAQMPSKLSPQATVVDSKAPFDDAQNGGVAEGHDEHDGAAAVTSRDGVTMKFLRAKR